MIPSQPQTPSHALSGCRSRGSAVNRAAHRSPRQSQSSSVLGRNRRPVCARCANRHPRSSGQGARQRERRCCNRCRCRSGGTPAASDGCDCNGRRQLPARVRLARFAAGILEAFASDCWPRASIRNRHCTPLPAVLCTENVDACCVAAWVHGRLVSDTATVRDSYPRACDLLVLKPGGRKHLEAAAGRVLASGNTTVRPS